MQHRQPKSRKNHVFSKSALKLPQADSEKLLLGSKAFSGIPQHYRHSLQAANYKKKKKERKKAIQLIKRFTIIRI